MTYLPFLQTRLSNTASDPEAADVQNQASRPGQSRPIPPKSSRELVHQNPTHRPTFLQSAAAAFLPNWTSMVRGSRKEQSRLSTVGGVVSVCASLSSNPPSADSGQQCDKKISSPAPASSKSSTPPPQVSAHQAYQIEILLPKLPTSTLPRGQGL
jgi:hypothetical protein